MLSPAHLKLRVNSDVNFAVINYRMVPNLKSKAMLPDSVIGQFLIISGKKAVLFNKTWLIY